MRGLALVLVLVSASAYAAKAYWTGRVEHVNTVTGRAGVSCEYDYAGTMLWRTFARSNCPVSIEVE
jgi:hypothetical protein